MASGLEDRRAGPTGVMVCVRADAPVHDALQGLLRRRQSGAVDYAVNRGLHGNGVRQAHAQDRKGAEAVDDFMRTDVQAEAVQTFPAQFAVQFAQQGQRQPFARVVVHAGGILALEFRPGLAQLRLHLVEHRLPVAGVDHARERLSWAR
jgi:hypothetical protein